MSNIRLKERSGGQILSFSMLIIVSIFFLNACNTGTVRPTDVSINGQAQTGSKVEHTNINADIKFMDDAEDIYQEEIKLGQLAQKKSRNENVIALGHMMETAHIQSLNQLILLAGKKNISIPAEASYQLNATYYELSEMPEVEFDKAYCLKMAAAHNNAIGIFARAALECVDSDIKKMADGMLTDFDSHLYHIVACMNKLEAKAK